MIRFERLQDQPQAFIDGAVMYIWNQWGTERNYAFYRDCIVHALQADIDLPKFYVAVEQERLIGMCAVLRNDLISRQDLFPWLACLYVDPACRGNGLGSSLMAHVASELKEKGHTQLFLSTTLDGYYERYGWTYYGPGYYLDGGATKIYQLPLKEELPNGDD
ncbi:GNAT family N-acetyltransferase [Paenibacillus montanisoli]|uniref:GNAT family N-acetyltransferase n=1 Tax=Paenibacillus montanisoli TaxID=2081970 RepID=A0A328U3U5_9BACL|nr:GNAT family N-acetyltransferase [Paenibacillus montanisoli]RAP76131.1 GNAT family N-acetyltransferase [Paenibacillus montanisoli]